MHISALPRHQIETTVGDYARMFGALVRGADRPDAVERFEREFAEYLGTRYAILVSSGRLGIHLLIEALGWRSGDEVIVPAFNLFAAIERFCQFGIAPKFADVRRDDLNIDASAAERLITPRTRAILATHMFGHPADLDALQDLARRHGLVLLEDCAHALGSTHAGQFVGTFGSAAIFSFSVLKLVTTFGGGMVTTNDDDLAAKIRRRLSTLRSVQPKPTGVRRAITGAIMDVGTRRLVFSLGAWPVLRALRTIVPDFQQRMMTETPRLDRSFDPARVAPLHPFQARLGSSQLARADELIARRRTVGQWLDDALAGITQVRILQPTAAGRHNGLYYGILAERASALSKRLFREGIDSETSEYLNCAALEMYQDHFVDCPVAREVQSRILRLPNYPGLSRSNVERIASAIRRFYG